jgi:hypothetical protein
VDRRYIATLKKISLLILWRKAQILGVFWGRKATLARRGKAILFRASQSPKQLAWASPDFSEQLRLWSAGF